MDHPPVLVLGYSEAAMLLRKSDAPAIGAVLSVVGQREFAVDAPQVPKRLVIEFDDVEVVDLRDPARALRAHAQQKFAAEMGRPATPPSLDNARAIIEFARDNREIEGALLCQCFAGISRSSAAALLCLVAWTRPGDEAYCMEELLRVRPSAMPHRDLVRFGDELLGREGRLIETVRMARLRGAE